MRHYFLFVILFKYVLVVLFVLSHFENTGFYYCFVGFFIGYTSSVMTWYGTAFSYMLCLGKTLSIVIVKPQGVSNSFSKNIQKIEILEFLYFFFLLRQLLRNFLQNGESGKNIYKFEEPSKIKWRKSEDFYYIIEYSNNIINVRISNTMQQPIIIGMQNPIPCTNQLYLVPTFFRLVHVTGFVPTSSYIYENLPLCSDFQRDFEFSGNTCVV